MHLIYKCLLIGYIINLIGLSGGHRRSYREGRCGPVYNGEAEVNYSCLIALNVMPVCSATTKMRIFQKLAV